MSRSRRCCCCLDLYVYRPQSGTRGVVQRLRQTASSVRVVESVTLPADDYAFYGLMLDFRFKRVYASGQKAASSDFALQSSSENLSAFQTVVTATGVNGEQSIGVWPFPETQQIFYGKGPTSTSSPTTASLRRINYDGTGDTALVSFTESGSGRTTVAWPSMPKNGSHVFYLARPSYVPSSVGSDKFDEIRRCLPDGSGDAAIYTCPFRRFPTPAAGFIDTIRIDNDHSKILFTERENAGTTRLRRCDFDGSNVETYHDFGEVLAVAIAPFWSHRRERVYFYRVSGTLGLRGFWSLREDGSDARQEVTGDAWIAAAGGAPDSLGPGCGFETTGPTYQV